MPRIETDDWSFSWRVTESAGLSVYLARFRGRPVLREGSLPYVTVDHQRPDVSVDDGAESHGPFWMPLGNRTLVGQVREQRVRGGVEIAADFEAGPFRYTQLWRFSDDGRLAPLLTIYGNGVHDAHTYHPHWRFDFETRGALEHFDGAKWRRIEREGWFPHTGEADDAGHAWRQKAGAGAAGVAIRPYDWEDAELYAVRYHEGEWAPFFPRSAAGSQPFPAAYVGDEALDGSDVTLWYVAHVHYDAAFPFTAGPWMRAQL